MDSTAIDTSCSRSPSTFPTQQASADGARVKRRAATASPDDFAQPSTIQKTAPVDIAIHSETSSPIKDALGRVARPTREASVSGIPAAMSSPNRGRSAGCLTPKPPNAGCSTEDLRVYIEGMFNAVERTVTKIMQQQDLDRARVDEMYQWPLQ